MSTKLPELLVVRQLQRHRSSLRIGSEFQVRKLPLKLLHEGMRDLLGQQVVEETKRRDWFLQSSYSAGCEKWRQ